MASFEHYLLESEWHAILQDVLGLGKYQLAVCNSDLATPSVPFRTEYELLLRDGLRKWRGVFVRGGFSLQPAQYVAVECVDGRTRYVVHPISGGSFLRMHMPFNVVKPDGLLSLGLGSLEYSARPVSPELKTAYAELTRLLKKRMERHDFGVRVWMGREARKLVVEKRAYIVSRGHLALPAGNDPIEADRLARLKLGLPPL